MQWAYEGKKLDATVKHMSWRPPWVQAPEEDSDEEYIDETWQHLDY